ncbi:TonB-dependent siderophore receptor [Sphingomonas sp. MG17]|uniref:TonB-dependent siderophore receptor n=1 Tax=Sphingomonas tagetis TaxID=2949092 RepID=A0A9X2HHG0_9SPHN|nr:TonB-dependent siderophore receptor [Sphingomonas tagetis]MCP3730898.1 TonB-dependent siderophore receptor [Sphingomonas tagetis]
MRKQTETNRRMKRLALLSACCIAALPGIAAAQDGQGSAGEDDDNIIVTGSRATTATKTDTPILRIPQAIEIVTLEEMQDRGAQNIREALKYTAGVYNASDDSRGDFNNIRGFQSVLFVDGLKRNYGFVYMPRPEIATLEKVEVLVGPASVLYGAGSASGLTNMQTKRPQFEFGGSASFSYGTHNRIEGTYDITGPISDNVAVRLVGVVRNSDSRMDYTPNDRVVGQGAITWRPSDRTDITAIGIYQRDNNAPNYNINPLITSLYAQSNNRIPDSRFFGEPGINKGNKEYAAATLLISHEFSDLLTFRSSTRYTVADTHQAEVYLNPSSTGNPLNPFVAGSTSRVNRNLFAINISYKVFNSDNNLGINFDTGPLSHKVLLGVDYSHFKQLSSQAFASNQSTIDIFNPVYGLSPGPVFAAPVTQILKQTGYYAQDQIDFGEIASLVLGIRRDSYSKQDVGRPVEKTNNTSKRAGLTVNITPTLAPFASYSESFLPISGLNQFGNTYVPLIGNQKEFGIKWQPLRSTLLRVSYYDVEEANSLRVDPANPLNRIQTGSVRSKGVEFQANHRTKDFSLTLAWSHADTRVSDQNYQQDAVPKTLASIYGTKSVELGNDLTLRVGAGVRHQGKMTSRHPTNGFIVHTPSYTLVDAMVAFDYKKWSLQFNAVNLMDDLYYPSCSYFGSCANGEPRTVNGTLTYRF